MTRPVPTLSSSGWLFEIAEKADRLMAYYLVNEHSQSYIFNGRIVSLPFHIKEYGKQPQRLQSRMEKDLTDFYGRYFDAVEVNVAIDRLDDAEKIELKIDLIVTQDGQNYSLGRMIKAENKKVQEIFNLNNTGN